jgi:hypothetical protein
MNESVSVEARFESDGGIRLLAFEWNGERFPIDSQGRDWEEDGEHRFLVMVKGDQIYDLALLRKECLWRLKRRPEDFRARNFI